MVHVRLGGFLEPKPKGSRALGWSTGFILVFPMLAPYMSSIEYYGTHYRVRLYPPFGA